MIKKPYTNPLGDVLPWEKTDLQKPKNIPDDVWDWWCELREAQKRGDRKKVQELSRRWKND